MDETLKTRIEDLEYQISQLNNMRDDFYRFKLSGGLAYLTGETVDSLKPAAKSATVGATSGTNLKDESAAVLYDIDIKNKFGGTGADGALAISSGTTTIDAAGASVVTKNYTSISITGTGKLTISNPHAKGTILILKSQGAVTITSSTNPAIDMKGMGADVATTGWGIVIVPTKGVAGVAASAGVDGGGGTAGAGNSSVNTDIALAVKNIPLFTGAGGAAGGQGNQSGGSAASVGAGARGGGAFYIECKGALNFTSTVSVAGNAGGNAGAGTGTWAGSGGGAGGGGGSGIILYNTLTANTGTITISGGAGGVASVSPNVTNFTGSVDGAGGGGGGGGGYYDGGNGGYGEADDLDAGGAGGAGVDGSGTGGGTGGAANSSAGMDGGGGGGGGAGLAIVGSNTFFT